MTDTTGYVHRTAMSSSAIALAALGILLLFAPSELDEALDQSPQADFVLQVLGAALVGWSTANWTARGSFLGGIYGRAVVAGNQAHFFIGALVLLGKATHGGRPVAFWLLFAVYVAGAAWFSWLLWGGGGRRPAPTS